MCPLSAVPCATCATWRCHVRCATWQAENPNHTAMIISGTGQHIFVSRGMPVLVSERLAPTSDEYLRAFDTAVKTNKLKPKNIAVDEKSAVARLQHVLGPAGVYAGYYPPPSEEELEAMSVLGPGRY